MSHVGFGVAAVVAGALFGPSQAHAETLKEVADRQLIILFDPRGSPPSSETIVAAIAVRDPVLTGIPELPVAATRVLSTFYRSSLWNPAGHCGDAYGPDSATDGYGGCTDTSNVSSPRHRAGRLTSLGRTVAQPGSGEKRADQQYATVHWPIQRKMRLGLPMRGRPSRRP